MLLRTLRIKHDLIDVLGLLFGLVENGEPQFVNQSPIAEGWAAGTGIVGSLTK